MTTIILGWKDSPVIRGRDQPDRVDLLSSQFFSHRLENVVSFHFSRQLGALMMLFGVCVLVNPQFKNARQPGETGVSKIYSPVESESNHEFLVLALVLGGVCQVVLGAFAVVTGFLAVVHDFGCMSLTRILILVAQTSWISLLAGTVHAANWLAMFAYRHLTSAFVNRHAMFLSFTIDMAEIVIQTQDGLNSGYIPLSYDPTLRDIRFFGAMGVLGIVGWYVGLFGSLSLIVFALHAFQSGNPDSRSKAFYQSRLVFYSVFSLLAAGSQLLLGVYVMGNFGSGPLQNPVAVAMYLIVYPELSIVCGSVQALLALFGFARAAGVISQPDNHLYQCMALLSWVVTMAGPVMAQVYSLPAGDGASLIVLSVGLHLLPAFLDFKMRNLPYVFPPDLYYTPGALSVLDVKDLPSTSDEKSELKASEPKSCTLNDASSSAETSRFLLIVAVKVH
jgi:hypothetical protein